MTRTIRPSLLAWPVALITATLATGCAADHANGLTAATRMDGAAATAAPEATTSAEPTDEATPVPTTTALAATPTAQANTVAGETGDGEAQSVATVTPPPSDGVLDYQLGGAYVPASDVTIVERDRTSTPAAGLYNICYVNVFQTQPGDDPTEEGTTAWWQQNYPDLLLRDDSGALVMDDAWNEALFDIRTRDKREQLFEIQSAWITGCADAGFDAIEADNLDQDSRSQGLQKLNDAVQYMRLFIPYAHAEGLAVGQKNTAELGATGPTLISDDEGFDFAIAEECEVYEECSAYQYPGHLLEIEYTDTPLITRGDTTQSAFDWACEESSGEHPITLRDRDLVTPVDQGYAFDTC
ncbi:MAG: endo alpha-1,4 polygalactosaminidase [Microbacterium sp.]